MTASRTSRSLQPLDVAGTRYLVAPMADVVATRMPFSLRVLYENVMRQAARGHDVGHQADALIARKTGTGLSFFPSRVFTQDLLGIPLLVDFAALRDGVAEAGGDPRVVNPRVATDLVVDHSLRVDVFGRKGAPALNLALEHARNAERFQFLRWAQQTFDRLRVVPPGKGIMHQINLEYLSRVVWTETTPEGLIASPDTLVGTDSHTTMVNGLGVLGWGTGGIEAEAVMLGRAVSVALPDVVGIEVTGTLADGVTPTDLVLHITERLRGIGVVGKFVEFFGSSLSRMPVADRATIANMAPEYGATAVYFPIDRSTADYLTLTGRETDHIRLVEAYARHQHLWREPDAPAPEFASVVHLDLASVRPSIAGPKNPEQRIDLDKAAAAFSGHCKTIGGRAPAAAKVLPDAKPNDVALPDGAVVIAAITSCTNTSNPQGMAAAGLLARNAVARGLTTKPWVKTSLAPGSQVAAAMLEKAGLQSALDALGFHVVGFGCTTCNGMSGPLPEPIAAAIERDGTVATAVLSGNRNFEGRIHPNVRAAYLASPALVVAYALAGSMTVDVANGVLGHDPAGQPVRLADLWPSAAEIHAAVDAGLNPALFRAKYASVFDGDPTWMALGSNTGPRFDWDPTSTYLRRPPYFDGLPKHPAPPSAIIGMRPLAILGDQITTDHISPSGAISLGTPGADFLVSKGVPFKDFNSYGTRRGNYQVFIRASFANIRLKNAMVPGQEGGVTRLMPDDRVLPIFDAATEYQKCGVPLVVIAGTDYGCGSSRDTAAKGVALLGVKAVIAESFERIHRTNLVGMGVLPLTFERGQNAHALQLDGSETFDLPSLNWELGVRAPITCGITRRDGNRATLRLTAELQTSEELDYWRHGGILPAVWREVMSRD